MFLHICADGKTDVSMQIFENVKFLEQLDAKSVVNSIFQHEYGSWWKIVELASVEVLVIRDAHQAVCILPRTSILRFRFEEVFNDNRLIIFSWYSTPYSWTNHSLR